MVVIRLKRVGVKHNPCYRVLVADSRRAVGGKYIEVVGHYQPLQKDKPFTINEKRYEYWVQKGAQPTLTVKNLVKKKNKK